MAGHACVTCGAWVLLGLVAIALASPLAAAVVGLVLAAVWAAGRGRKCVEKSAESGANQAHVASDAQESTQENQPSRVVRY